jgi:hypothetical protein
VRNRVFVVFFRGNTPESFILVTDPTTQIIKGIKAGAEINGQRIILAGRERIMQLFPDTAQLWRDIHAGN